MKNRASIVLVSLLLCFPFAAIAETERLLTVSGEADVEVPPDFVKLEVLIAADDADVDDAKADVDSRTRRAIAAIEKFEIDDADLSFSGVNVNREYKYDRNDNEKLIGYSVRRTISIKLREFKNYEQLVHLLVAAGIDELQDVQSDVDDEAVLERAALEGAAKAARLKAESIASGLGVQLGSPVEVSERGFMPSLNMRQGYADEAIIEEMVVSASRVGVVDPMLFVPENITVRGVVWVRFEILGQQNEQ